MLRVFNSIGHKENLIGALFINTSDFSFDRYVPLTFTPGFFAGNIKDSVYNDKFNVLMFNEDNTDDIFITTIEREKEIPVAWKLWRQTEKHEWQPVAKNSFASYFIKQKQYLRDFEPALFNKQSVQLLKKNVFSINWNDDRVYKINTQDNSVSPIFFPGSETLQIRVGSLGNVFFFEPGFKRFYVSRL